MINVKLKQYDQYIHDKYLDYFNNYLTAEKYASDNGLSTKQMNKFLFDARKVDRKICHINNLNTLEINGSLRQLKQLEKDAHKLAEDCCNFLSMESIEFEDRYHAIAKRVVLMLPKIEHCVKINLDPRGYALKIDFEKAKIKMPDTLEQDWGGYGILCPDYL